MKILLPSETYYDITHYILPHIVSKNSYKIANILLAKTTFNAHPLPYINVFITFSHISP
jgi:hypothetical protein